MQLSTAIPSPVIAGLDPTMTAQLLDDHRSVSIVAGHYCVAEELSDLSHDGESEINSFEYGVRMHVALRRRGVTSRVVLFVNDIGISKEQRASILDPYLIPENYREILRRHEVPLHEVEPVFESVVRNRASKEIRKMKKRDTGVFEVLPSTDRRLVRCVDAAAACEIPSQTKEAITIKGPDDELLVVKEGSNPKCNTILATLFKYFEQDHASDLCINCFNVIYVNRIHLGIHVARTLFKNQMRMVNLFFDESGLLA